MASKTCGKLPDKAAELSESVEPGVRVILFVRSPRLGAVKTRLARDVGAQAALDLHRACAADVLDTLDACGLPVEVRCHPATDAALVRDWLGPGRIVRGQHGVDLGSRMRHALDQALAEGAPTAMILGSDLPHLPPGFLAEAARDLGYAPAALGPATDGGYYLVGFRGPGPVPDVFTDMPWGSPDVLALTLDRLRRKDISPALLPQLRDLDTLADAQALAGEPGLGRRTRAAIERMLREYASGGQRG